MKNLWRGFGLLMVSAAVALSAADAQSPGSQAPGTLYCDLDSLGAAAAGLRTSAAELVLVTSPLVDCVRSAQLFRGVAEGRSLLLRSASTLGAQSGGPALVGGAHFIAPQFLIVNNSAIPFSQNYGALWAGKGSSTRTLLGFEAGGRRARLIVAPEIIISSNSDWALGNYYRPPVPADRAGGGYVFPYYIGRFSIDQPLRFGDKPIRRFDAGQSSAIISGRSFEYGVSNENEWWGPGIRNAIILSNNAPGFPHLFARTAHPLKTRLGSIEGRWLVGGLTESKYFDTVSTNNVRSISAIAATLQTAWDPDLSIGVARSVYAVSNGWGAIPFRWLNVFSDVHHPEANAPANSTQTPGGKDQLFSLFSRWVFPADGAEVYAEWARAELPRNLRDLLVAPNHSQGYTLGAQWRRVAGAGSVRLQAEVTQLEQSATFIDRPLGSWYTSRKVIQGYTNRGEILGGAIGPGASSQWLAVDYFRTSWSLGAFAGRIRWNQDVETTAGFPDYVGYCNIDLSLYPGVRGAKVGAFGSVSAEWSFQNRLNAFFQNGGGCPNNGRRTDIRNNTISVTFSPFAR